VKERCDCSFCRTIQYNVIELVQPVSNILISGSGVTRVVSISSARGDRTYTGNNGQVRTGFYLEENQEALRGQQKKWHEDVKEEVLLLMIA